MDFGKDGNEVRYTAPGVAPLTFGYDLDRALASVTNEDGSSSTLGYDTAGRVTSVTYPGGPLGVAYDPKTGQLRTLTTPGSSLAIDYDGLLVRGVTATGPAPGTVTFTYDGMLRRGSEQVGTSTVKYGYDHDGLLTQAGSIAMGRESASGLIAGIDVVNAAQRFTHTPFGELATYRSQGAGGNVLDVALTYDALARIVDKVENGAAWHYDYDVRGRLTRVRKDGADVATYAYDANGNRADGAAVIDAQDRVLSMNGATYTYSAAGERLTRTTGAGVTTYIYDGRGHLSSVTAPSGVRADYDLDAYGRRVTKRRNGTVQNRFLYRNGLQPIADVDAAGALVSRYIYARGELGPDALERAGATYLLLKDERGSIRFVIDATSGAVSQALAYDAFGRVLSDTNPGFQPFGFAGGIYDADTGLVHFGARDYDPETGSFTRKDPSRFGGGENLYAYAGGDPINFVDPDGESVVGAVVGGLEGAIINYADEAGTQALDPNWTGYDCDKIRSAAKVGAILGAVSGATKARGKQCFAAGTEVATENGPKAIEAVAVGDRVLSSTEEGEASYQPVTRVFQRSGAEEVALTFTDAHGVGAPIVTTPEHPFRVASGEWVVAGRLDIGDNVVTAEGGLATLSAALSLEKSGTVYNFEVEGTHSYFVGTAKLWVHNACNRPPNKSPSGAGREGAFNQAKRNNGVPTSRQPESTGPNLDRRGNVQPGLQYNFRDSHGNPVTIRDDSAGHSYGAGVFKTAARTSTTLLAITMTTDAALEVATSANAAGFRYVRDPTIGVVSAIKRSCTPSSSSKAALARCTDLIGPVVRRVISALPGATLLMFAASPLWDEPNALARRRGLWGTKELRWLPADALRTQPLEISGQAGSRFAGVAEIDLERWLDAADFVRTNAASFLFVSTRGEIQSERARATFHAVFPSDSTLIDWGCVIDQIGTGADACIRVSGNFDDRDVAIDVFLASESFAKLELR